MKFFTKKRIAFVLAIAAVLALAQCDFVRVAASQTVHHAVEVEFPMGEGREVSFPIRSWVEKPYAMGLIVEYANSGKTFAETPKEIPFSLSVSCYRLKKNREVLFFQKHYSKGDNLYTGNGYVPKYPHSNDAWAEWGALGGFRLPYGRYRCDFKDISTPEIKAYLQNAGVVKTYIVVKPILPRF